MYDGTYDIRMDALWLWSLVGQGDAVSPSRSLVLIVIRVQYLSEVPPVAWGGGVITLVTVWWTVGTFRFYVLLICDTCIPL